MLTGPRLPNGIFFRAAEELEPFISHVYSILTLDSFPTSKVIYFKRKKCILFEAITDSHEREKKKRVICQTDLASAGLHFSKMKVPSKY